MASRLAVEPLLPAAIAHDRQAGPSLSRLRVRPRAVRPADVADRTRRSDRRTTTRPCSTCRLYGANCMLR